MQNRNEKTDSKLGNKLEVQWLEEDNNQSTLTSNVIKRPTKFNFSKTVGNTDIYTKNILNDRIVISDEVLVKHRKTLKAAYRAFYKDGQKDLYKNYIQFIEAIDKFNLALAEIKVNIPEDKEKLKVLNNLSTNLIFLKSTLEIEAKETPEIAESLLAEELEKLKQSASDQVLLDDDNSSSSEENEEIRLNNLATGIFYSQMDVSVATSPKKDKIERINIDQTLSESKKKQVENIVRMHHQIDTLEQKRVDDKKLSNNNSPKINPPKFSKLRRSLSNSGLFKLSRRNSKEPTDNNSNRLDKNNNNSPKSNK